MAYSSYIGGVATADFQRVGIRTSVFWRPYGGMILPTSTFHIIHGLSDVVELGTLSASPLNERDIFEAGKSLLQTNDGFTWTQDIMVEGSSIHTVASLIGQVLSTYPVIPTIRDYGVKGDLILMSRNSTNQIISWDCYTNVAIKIDEIPGIVNGDTNWTIRLYGKDNSRYIRIPGEDYGVGVETWYDNGTTIINADAPDGVLTDFVLGTGNDSFGSATTPVASIIDPSLVGVVAATDPLQYMMHVRLNGVGQSYPAVTFTVGSSTLRFATAPADGSKLELLYATEYDSMPLFEAGAYNTDWKNHNVI